MDSVSVGKSKSKVEVAPFYNEYHGLFGINLTAEREEHRAWFEAKGAVNKSVMKKELNEVRLRVSNNSAIKGALYPPIGPPRIPTREKVMHREGSVILKENPRARTTESQTYLLHHPTMPGDGVRVTKSGGRGDAVRVAFGSRPGIASSVTKLAKVNENESKPRKERKEKKESTSTTNELESLNGSYEDISIDINDMNTDLQTDSLMENESSVQSERREEKVPTSPLKPKPPISRAPKTTNSRINTRGYRSGNNSKPISIEKTKDVKPLAAPVVEKGKGNNSSSNSSSSAPKATKPSSTSAGNDKKQIAASPRPHPRKVSTTTKKSSASTQLDKGQISNAHLPSNPEVDVDVSNIDDTGDDDKEYYDDASFEEETLPLSAPSVLPPEPAQTSSNYSFDETDAEAEAEDEVGDKKTKKLVLPADNTKHAGKGEIGDSTKKDLEESGYDDASFEDDQDQSPVKSTQKKIVDNIAPIISNHAIATENKNHNNNDNDKKNNDFPHTNTSTSSSATTTATNQRSKALESLSDGSNAHVKRNRDMKNKLKDNVEETYEEDYENDVDFNL